MEYEIDWDERDREQEWSVWTGTNGDTSHGLPLEGVPRNKSQSRLQLYQLLNNCIRLALPVISPHRDPGKSLG